MRLFSQRKGLKPTKKIQVDSVDNELRNRLWDLLYFFCFWYLPGSFISRLDTDIELFILKLWRDYFKEPTDTLNDSGSMAYNKIRNYFFTCKWYEVYNFIEFFVSSCPYIGIKEEIKQLFISDCNKILAEESSAYRLVGNEITPITTEEEISEIEESLQHPLDAVRSHIKRALELLSDRKSPDYRNSIKESISAVESICNLIIKKKTTLGEALKKIKDKVGLHPALEEAFSKLYGYTSDENGIRHALLDEPNIGFEEAKFMLVACSAFTNYLFVKAEKAGIKI